MKNLILVAISFIALATNAQARRKADRDTDEFRYELQCAGVGQDGTYLVKVWSYSKRGIVAIEQAKKNAVHGIVFKGFPGEGGCASQKAIANDPNVETEKQEFFDTFFQDGGNYMKYVSVSSDGMISADDRKKVGKEYKIGVVVSVMKDALRKDLEAAGIVRGLSSGF
ncbi:hypothetical protein [Flavobacterium sp.]|uniref:hypothetical protein n=1 Tax=Flavobacterium sp. TaxID=239 RepID=UPI003D14804C